MVVTDTLPTHGYTTIVPMSILIFGHSHTLSMTLSHQVSLFLQTFLSVEMQMEHSQLIQPIQEHLQIYLTTV